MQLSLLNRGDEQYSQVSPQTVEHLSLHRMISFICENPQKRKAFLKYLTRLPSSPQDVQYRQAVFKDFIQFPALLSQMSDLMERFGKCKTAREQYRRNRLKNLRDASMQIFCEAARTDMRTSALNLKTCLLFVKALFQLLEEFPVSSTGLQEMRTEAEKLSTSPAFSELISLCSRLEFFGSSEPIDIRVELNELGMIKNASLIDHHFIRIIDPDRKSKRMFFKKSKESEDAPSIKLAVSNHTVYNRLISQPLYELANLFDQLNGEILDRFCEIENELIFFEVGALYYNFLQQKRVPIVFPTFAETEKWQVSGLYDLFLLTFKKTEEIIPHSITFDEKGCVIFGNNGSGKTVFLRSIGSMQLLAQAGLPVPADQCLLKIRKNIVTLFAASEEKNCDDAGRFEQEVRYFSEKLQEILPESLVLLNEIFQTTAYEEGARGLADILTYFSEDHISWLCVSHLKQLQNHLPKSRTNYIYLDTFHPSLQKAEMQNK
ncbi:MAG: hypothetical protein IJW92_06205 [Clostridia bacterium]|nr:hypothetical protein [Clostridia bacterium]